MSFRNRLIAATLIAAGTFVGLARAQAQEVVQAIPVLQLEHVVDMGPFEARILETQPEDRTLTVRLDSNNEEARLIVPRNADIVRTFPNDIERDIELDQLDPGDKIMVEGVEVDGIIELHIVIGNV